MKQLLQQMMEQVILWDVDRLWDVDHCNLQSVTAVALESNRSHTSSSNGHLEMWSNPSYEDIRAEAAIHAKLRAESFQKAAEARSKKQGELAMFYAQQVRIV